MRYNDNIQILNYSLKRNRVRLIILILFTMVGLVIGGYAGVLAYYNGWLG